MKVIADGRWLGNTGIGRVYKEVIKRKPDHVNLDVIEGDFPLGHPGGPLFLSRQIIKSDAEIFYSPSFMPPLSSSIPFVITIHDLNHIYYYSLFHKIYLKYVIRNLADKAKKIITVSEFTKDEIVNKLTIKAEKIEVIYNGIDESFHQNRESLVLERPYFLYIGNRRSYKNINRMLKAFAVASISRDYLLAFSGEPDDLLRKEIEMLNISNRIKFFGNIDDRDLPSIYKGATALLFVSLMEGFGLPVLEAMASGTPVITSNITSLPEIAGSAAILVNPNDIKDISIAIERIVTDTALRSSLINLGFAQAKNFSWDKAAKQTWDIILK